MVEALATIMVVYYVTLGNNNSTYYLVCELTLLHEYVCLDHQAKCNLASCHDHPCLPIHQPFP